VAVAWKIWLGIGWAGADVVLLAWLVGEHAYRWLVSGLVVR
jgi:hypothetical protein